MFRRPWVRVISVAAPLGWAVFEFAGGAPFWGVIFAALGAYAAWELYLRGPDEGKDR
jgi:hypothetical protein